MAVTFKNRFANILPTRAVLLVGAATTAALSIAAMASPSSASPRLARTQIEPSDAMVAAMIAPRTTPSSAKPAELLHDASASAPVSTPARHAAARTKQIWMTVTAYCPCAKCCGADASGITASGRPVSFNHGKFVAADTDLLPFGTKLSIPGYHDGETVKVIDRGGAIKGHHIDVYFSSHAVATEWGTRRVQVTVQADE